MTARSNKKLTRVCLRLWQEDYEAIRTVAQATGEVGINLMIRQIVHSYVIQLKAQENKRLDQIGMKSSVEPIAIGEL